MSAELARRQGASVGAALLLAAMIALPAIPTMATTTTTTTRTPGLDLAQELPDDGLFLGTSVAWADINADGYSDLAVGFDSDLFGSPGAVRIYRNDRGVLTRVTEFAGLAVSSLAWGDYNNDGRPDLAAGVIGGSTRVYRNDSAVGGAVVLALAWTSPEAGDLTYDVAWQDVDGDGNLDLSTATGVGSPNRLYSGNGAGGFTRTDLPGQDNATTLAWADFDRDTFPDVVFGYAGAHSEIYRNTGSLFVLAWPVAPPVGPAPQTSRVVFEDFDSDGDPDLAEANSAFQPTRLLRNDSAPGAPNFTLVWSASGRESGRALAWGDFDGDGDGDLAVANDTSTSTDPPVRIYRNERTVLVPVPAWDTGTPARASALSWGDLDNDGDLDLAVAIEGGQTRIYRNRLRAPKSTVLVRDERGQPVEGALIYRRAEAATPLVPEIDDNGNPVRTSASGEARVEARVGTELVALAPLQTVTTLTSTHGPLPLGPMGGPAETVATISVPDSISPDARILDVDVVGLNGTHTWVGDLTFELESPAGTRITLVPPSCGNLDNVSLTLDDEAPAGELPCPLSGTARPFERLAAFDGETMRVAGPVSSNTWTLRVTDSFLPEDSGTLQSWGLRFTYAPTISVPGSAPRATLYQTSAAPTLTGLAAFTVTDPDATQELTVRSQYPLVLFDLVVSLEWDARKDTGYLSQLLFDLQRTSELIYDWSNGQAALGQVQVYLGRARWNDADVRIYATNRLRPNADQGGVAANEVNDPDLGTLSYAPGQVRMGAVWNRYGDQIGTRGEDWPRALAHELGHYLFYLNDNYIGFDNFADPAARRFISVETCRGVMANPYEDVESEFHPQPGWLATCDQTLSHVVTGRSDWETITRFYQAMQAPAVDFDTMVTGNNALGGPTSQPLGVTSISVFDPGGQLIASPLAGTGPTELLDAPVINLVNAQGARLFPGPGARAYLFQCADAQPVTACSRYSYLVDLGRATLDKINARGARLGDQVCLFEPATGLSGCSSVRQDTTTLTLLPIQGSMVPNVIVEPQDAQNVSVFVPNIPPGQTVKAQLFPANGVGSEVITLQPVVGGGYRERFATLPERAIGALVHVWVEPGPGTPISATTAQSQIITDYALGGSPAPPNDCETCAPAVSSDGQVILYSRLTQFNDGDFYTLQSATVLPPPLPWSTIVGRGYRLVATPGAPPLDPAEVSINISYLERDVPAGTEGGIAVYYLAPGSQQWRKIVDLSPDPSQRKVRLDAEHNEVTAPVQGPGLYVLMTSVGVRPGWNLFSYPWEGQAAVDEGMARIGGAVVDGVGYARSFTIVYGFDANDRADPWKVFDVDVPAWVNDLKTLEYGRGYWVNVTEKGDSAPGTATARTAQTAGAVTTPPSTFYGIVPDELRPRAGQAIVARVGEVVCGRTTAIDYPGAPGVVAFVVDVYADDGGQYAGCGTPGRTVRVTLEEGQLIGAARWDNSRVRPIGLLMMPVVAR